ncbi:MAG: hypothetical protein M3539_06185 [Acidobacteriota bacterium]|nr:hypothetical protein [Acidobacteriota bacterium]
MPDDKSWLIEKICLDIDKLVSKRSSEEDLKEFINGVNTEKLLNSCLATAKSKITHLNDVCKSSYDHPNGFVKLTLVDRIPAWALRLHIWRKPVNEIENDLHDHCGYLVSKIVKGELINDVYERCDETRGSTYFSYADVLDESQHKLAYLGMSNLILQRREIFRSPISYFLGGDVIHRTAPFAGFPVISLVLQGPKYKTTSLIYRLSERKIAEVVSTTCSSTFYFDSLEEASRHG